ncbi:TetR/AcrR family transcriptional regulator [Streptomyces shenzhenensis]|uniref:TetR family transcriptional regulator n=1 Tax=Streptomyces shenzhenensis TaxID=943815 RepID=A0A3M0HUA2_9ACTN|nr:TetR/AcrR family transcriptional regulator [Streptomyces shenzhenensis]RMB79780.1 TetR family transcriptional regulator [Streptomyces shenzhenensis]
MNPERLLRADAARNAERILRAARTVFAESGPDAQLEEIARHAGVGIRTLYRRFAHKGDLARGALEQAIDEDIAPAIEHSLHDDDPLHALTSVMEAAMVMAARERNTLAAARNAGTLTSEVIGPYYESLTLLARNAQEAGRIRADLVPDDLPRIMAMLFSVLWSMDQDSDGWRRYLSLVLDGLAPAAASPLPAAVPLRNSTTPHDWLL